MGTLGTVGGPVTVGTVLAVLVDVLTALKTPVSVAIWTCVTVLRTATLSVVVDVVTAETTTYSFAQTVPDVCTGVPGESGPEVLTPISAKMSALMRLNSLNFCQNSRQKNTD